MVCVPQTLITGLCATLVCARSSTDVWRACSQTVREAFQAEGPGEGAAEEEVDLRRGDAREGACVGGKWRFEFLKYVAEVAVQRLLRPLSP